MSRYGWIALFFLCACGSKPSSQQGSGAGDIFSLPPDQLTAAQLEERLKTEPDNPDLHYFHALYAYEGGDFTSAIEDFTQAISLDSTFVSAYHDRGAAKFEIMDYEGAYADYSNAIAMEDSIPEYYSNRGMTLVKLNRPQEALKDLDFAIALAPDFPNAYYERGKLRLSEKIEGGCDDLRKALNGGISQAEALLNQNCP